MSLPSSLQILRQRIIEILNSKFKNIYKKYKINYQFQINQAKLQDWTELIDQIIMSKPIAKNIQSNYKPKISPTFTNTIILQKPLNEQLNPILKVQDKFVQILIPSLDKNNYFTILKEKVQLQSQIIKKHSSCTVISQFSALFIGGCSSASNPNLKSPNILQFMLKTGQIYEIGKLPYGLSSHSSIFIQDYIFIIGGNRDHGIISRGCFRFSFKTKLIQEISCLNYPTTSMCLVNWKNQFIYKLGGLGECFESWGLSPYIQRYSIQNDFWQTINPSISSGCKQYFDNYNLMIQSFGYVTQTDKIIVFGGFNLQGQAQNIGFVMKIQNQQVLDKGQNTQIQNQTQHENHIIENIGQIRNLPKGGFINTEFIYSKEQKFIHLVQRKLNKQRNYSQQFIQLKIQ